MPFYLFCCASWLKEKSIRKKIPASLRAHVLLEGSQELISLVSFDATWFEMQELLGQMSSVFANPGGAGKICSDFLG